MEIINHKALRKDNPLLVLTHLSQLLTMVTGFGGFVVPLVLWLTQKDSVQEMDEQGKEIINFQISMVVYSLISIPAILLLGLGFLMLFAIGILAFVMPIINAVNVSNGKTASYPFTIKFIS